MGRRVRRRKKGVKIQFKNQNRRAMCRAEQTDVTEWNIVWIKISTTQFNSSDCYSRTLYSIDSETERREKFFIKFSPILPFSHRHIVSRRLTLYSAIFSLFRHHHHHCSTVTSFDDTMHINLTRIVRWSENMRLSMIISDLTRLDSTWSKYCRLSMSHSHTQRLRSARKCSNHIRPVSLNARSCSEFDENVVIK